MREGATVVLTRFIHHFHELSLLHRVSVLFIQVLYELELVIVFVIFGLLQLMLLLHLIIIIIIIFFDDDIIIRIRMIGIVTR